MSYLPPTCAGATRALLFARILLKLCRRRMVAFAVWMATFGAHSLAAELVFPGIDAKLAAGAGQTVSRGPASLFYNPANLIYSRFLDTYIDVSFAMVTYNYQHADSERYGATTVKVNAPPVTAGLTFRPIPALAVGFAILPLGIGAAQEIAHVPLQLQGDAYQLMNLEQKQTAYKLAAGIAFRPMLPIVAGISIIRDSDKTELLGYRVDEDSLEQSDESPFLDAVYATTYMQIVGGVRAELLSRKLVLGLSYKTAATKEYKGDFLIDIDPSVDYLPYDGKGYAPAVLGFGVETRLGPLAVFFDYTREMWRAGRTIAKRGFASQVDELDFVDSNNFAGGLKYWLARNHMLMAAAGMYGANIGDGTLRETDDDLALKAAATRLQSSDEEPFIGGVRFGDLEAISRLVFAGGYRYRLAGNGYFKCGLSYQSGSRTVPEGADGEGQYTLSVLMGSVGLAYGF